VTTKTTRSKRGRQRIVGQGRQAGSKTGRIHDGNIYTGRRHLDAAGAYGSFWKENI